MGVTILGLGTALPAVGVSQATSAAMSAPYCCRTDQQTRVFAELYRRSRIDTRYSVLLERDECAAARATASQSRSRANGRVSGEVATAATQLQPRQTFFTPRTHPDDRGPTTQERMTRYARESTPLALAAARRAIHEAGIDADAIAHLVSASCTGFVAPGVDVALVRELGLAATVSRTHIGFMGCHGTFNALRVAGSYARAGGLTLVCAVELCSLHFAYGWDPQQIVANALFADGAGAAVVGDGMATNTRHATDRSPSYELVGNGSVIVPGSEEAMTWTIGDHGFAMTLSPAVPGLIDAHLRPWVEGWLAGYGLTVDSVGSWAVHPGGPRILQAVSDALNLERDALATSHAVLAECGNMSSATILFILQRLRQAGAPRPCVALGFGPGLTIEGMVLG